MIFSPLVTSDAKLFLECMELCGSRERLLRGCKPLAVRESFGENSNLFLQRLAAEWSETRRWSCHRVRNLHHVLYSLLLSPLHFSSLGSGICVIAVFAG